VTLLFFITTGNQYLISSCAWRLVVPGATFHDLGSRAVPGLCCITRGGGAWRHQRCWVPGARTKTMRPMLTRCRLADGLTPMGATRCRLKGLQGPVPRTPDRLAGEWQLVQARTNAAKSVLIDSRALLHSILASARLPWCVSNTPRRKSEVEGDCSSRHKTAGGLLHGVVPLMPAP
jgi:hypothetical protein